MRGLSGAIVILAGSTLVAASVLGAEIANHGHHFISGTTTLSGLGGVVLIVGGLIVGASDVLPIGRQPPCPRSPKEAEEFDVAKRRR